MPDYQRASRIVVKDYSEGKLLYCHSPPPLNEDVKSSLTDEDYQRETLTTAIRNTKNSRKLRNLQQSLEIAAKAQQDFDDNDDDSILGDLDNEDESNNCNKRGKSHKSIKKWGKKGRKLRNKDPYGCHADPDAVLHSVSASAGAIVNAGKYSTNYVRPNYAGAKAATPFGGFVDRPEKVAALSAV